MNGYIKTEKEFYQFLDAKNLAGKRILDDKDISVLGTLVHTYGDKIAAANILIDSYKTIIDSTPIDLGGDCTFTPQCDDHVRAVWDLVQRIVSNQQ